MGINFELTAFLAWEETEVIVEAGTEAEEKVLHGAGALVVILQ